jgi:hypothetical protein
MPPDAAVRSGQKTPRPGEGDWMKLVLTLVLPSRRACADARRGRATTTGKSKTAKITA